MRLIKCFFISSFFSICFMACKTDRENHIIDTDKKIINNVLVSKDLLILNASEGKWYYELKPFSGYAVKFHSNKMLEEKVGYYEGKKEGLAQKWFSDGLLQKESFYIANHLDGVVKIWWPNGNIASEANYIKGTRNGVQKKWFTNGQLSKRTNLIDGKENGMQQAWLENGKLYVNYEAKNGRVFGLKRANLCYKLENEIVQFKKL